MSNRITLIAILVVVLFTTNIQAQNPAATAGSASSVTGSVTPEGVVRMIAHGEALQIRMEVYSATGELVSDSGLRQGNIVDWKQSDATQSMTDGSYLVVVTVKDFKGNLTQRIAALSLQTGQLNLQKQDEVTTAQAQILESRQSQKTKMNGLYSLAFGDTNKALGTSSIVFGSGNHVKGSAGISAGAGNRVCDTYGVAFGNKAISGGPLINGTCDPDSFNIHGLAAVALGYNVTADQDHSFALGKFASTNGFSGAFVWGDGSATSSVNTFKAVANNEFAARATGGFRFRTNLAGTTGCNLPAGSGVFNCTSSRATKENFLLVDGGDVLSRLRGIDVSTWNYIAEGRQVRHMGPGRYRSLY